MREMLVAMFGTDDRTNRAVSALTASGVPSSAIHRCTAGEAGVQPALAGPAGGGPRTDGFWSWLTGQPNGTSGRLAQDYETYRRAMAAGRTVLAVTVGETEAQRTLDVLQAQSPDALESAGQAGNTQIGENVGPTATTGRVPPGTETTAAEPVDRNAAVRLTSMTGATRVRRYRVG